MAKAVALQRNELLALLRSDGWTLDGGISAKTLMGVVLEMLEKGGEDFVQDLVKLLAGESNFTGDGPQLTVGADPVSAVAGAIGSLAELAKTAVNRKQVKRQAQAATLAALLDARRMPVAISRPSAPPKPTRKSPLPWIVLGGGLLALGVLAFIHLNSTSP